MKRVLHPAGDFHCTWHVRDEDGRLRNFPGTLAVRPGERPSGDLHGLELSEPGDLYPRRETYPILTATLASGASAVVMQAEVEFFLPGRALLQGNLALITIGSYDDLRIPQAHEIEMQIECLDALSGLQPLIPGDDSRGSWSAQANPGASLTWSQNGMTATVDYTVTTAGYDPYSVRVEALPRITIKSAQPLDVVRWTEDWVRPLEQLCSIAAGRPCSVTYVILKEASTESSQLSQLYAKGITQQPYTSDYRAIFGVSLGLNLFEDNISLLSLAVGWQKARDESHPIVETYGSMHLTSEHPRSRLLLLLQTVEGAYGFERRDAFAVRLKAHEADIESLLQKVRDCTNAKDRSKIKSSLKLLHPGLEEALTDLFASLPFDMRPWLAKTALISKVREGTPLDVVAALRTVRNDLAHGNRSYDGGDLRQLVTLLDRVVRARTLALLGCPDPSLIAVLKGGGPRR